ncbi:hypothetical protein Plhal304r1_c048g0130231 [Plasmopara halstedii]
MRDKLKFEEGLNKVHSTPIFGFFGICDRVKDASIVPRSLHIEALLQSVYAQENSPDIFVRETRINSEGFQ